MRAAAADHLQAKVDRLVLGARTREPIDEYLYGQHDRSKNADQYQRADPGRIHASNFASGRNNSAESVMPCAITSSRNLGRMPVASKRPWTILSADTPVCRKRKISCMVITSPSIPVSSDRLMSFRRPSASRATWMTTL